MSEKKPKLRQNQKCSHLFCVFKSEQTVSVTVKIRTAEGFGFDTKPLCLEHAIDTLKSVQYQTRSKDDVNNK